MKTPKYFRDTRTGRIFGYSPHYAEMPFMVPCDGPGKVEEPKAQEPEVSRTELIINAIRQIPEEEWGKGANPAPKVGDVSELVGFKVSAQEIYTALQFLNRDKE